MWAGRSLVIRLVHQPHLNNVTFPPYQYMYREQPFVHTMILASEHGQVALESQIPLSIGPLILRRRLLLPNTLLDWCPGLAGGVPIYMYVHAMCRWPSRRRPFQAPGQDS